MHLARVLLRRQLAQIRLSMSGMVGAS